MESQRTKHFLQLVLVLLAVAGITAFQRHAAAPRTFHGTLRFPVMNIGGEGSEAKLVTADGAWDLFFPAGSDARLRLGRLAGLTVVVVGHARTAHGIERGRYHAIDVIEIALDEPRNHAPGK